MTSPSSCVFCRIVAGELPAERVAETQRTLAFRDLAPQAPTHVLVVPKAHLADVGALADADAELLAALMADAVAVARAEQLDGGYRLVLNTGADAGQTVFHAHVHVLGGQPLGRLG
ncbi:MAG: HIT domain-containing protein [Actinomycetota bacterium]|nr:HIT domain-containing protein [Actinomycetota bacterium]